MDADQKLIKEVQALQEKADSLNREADKCNAQSAMLKKQVADVFAKYGVKNHTEFKERVATARAKLTEHKAALEKYISETMAKVSAVEKAMNG